MMYVESHHYQSLHEGLGHEPNLIGVEACNPQPVLIGVVDHNEPITLLKAEAK